MKITNTIFAGLKIINSEKFTDSRGEFRELFRKNVVSAKKDFKFTCYSRSKKNVLRGLHLQKPNAHGKYITVIKGKILDVAVDLRKNSKTFGKYLSIKISDTDDFSFYIPAGFAHGFLCLSKECTINYKCSQYRDQKSEKTLYWKDAIVGINWPIKKPILSYKDKHLGLSLGSFLTKQ